MKMVHTVTGPVPEEALGHCQIHEHIFVRRTPMAEKNSALEIADEKKSLKELQCYFAAGGRAIVDAQPVGAGRDGEVLQRLSRCSGVAIVASTGYHLLGFYPEDHWIHTLERQRLEELYVRELTSGMLPWGALPESVETTGVLAGLVKAAIPAQGPIGRYKTLLQAAAGAAARCGAALMIHTEAGAAALEAVELCRCTGVPEKKIIVCHADRQADSYEIHEKIAACGVWLDYDTIGRFKYHTDEAEIALISHMVEKGWGGQLRLALDTTASRLGAYGGEISLCYLLEHFLMRLEAAGIPHDLVRDMTSCDSILAMEGEKKYV